MNDLLNFINTRRSIRKFTGQIVEQEKLNQILEAGMNAPSAGNARPWHFVVTQDRDTMLALHEKHAFSAMLKEAGAAIAICADLDLQKYDGPGHDFWVQDLSAATENILLATHALGLGGVWLSAYPYDREEDLKRILGVPRNIRLLSMVALGYTEEDINKLTPKKFDQTRIHWEKW